MPDCAQNFSLFLRLAVLPCLLLLSGSPGYCTTAEEHFKNGATLRFNNQIDAAIAEYKQGLGQNPASAYGHAQLGEIFLEEKGEPDAAISEFVTALSIDPGCRFCQLELNDALAKKNSKSQAEIMRGNLHYGLRQLQRAVACYRIACQSDPGDANAHNSLAWTLYRLGQLDEAKQEVEEALRLKPDDAEFVNTLACIQYDMGDADGALSTYRKAISLSKQPGAADLYGIAVVLLSKGDKSGAEANFAAALKTDPKYHDLEYVRDRIGMSVHALAAHEELISLLQKNGK